MFPPEIWEIIFIKIDDPFELFELQNITQNWNDIIKRILSRTNWKNWCKIYVPNFWFITMLTKANFTNLYATEYELDMYFWKNLYVSWRNLQLGVAVPSAIASTNGLLKRGELSRITCLAADSTDVLAVGTADGFIYFYHVNDTKRPFFIVNHKQPVMTIKFYSNISRIGSRGRGSDICDQVAVSHSANGKIKFWNYTALTGTIAVDIFGELVAGQLANNGPECYCICDGTLSQYEWANDRLTLSWDFKLPLGIAEEVVAYAITRTGPQMLTFNGKHTTFYDICQPTEFPSFPLEHEGKPPRLLPSYLATAINKRFCFVASFFAACITDDRLAFSIENRRWIVYNIIDLLGGNVSAVQSNIHGTALIMGLDTGVVYLFSVGQLRDWENFDFTTQSLHKIVLQSGPIISVNYCTIADQCHIIAVTENEIYVDRKNIKNILSPPS